MAVYRMSCSVAPPRARPAVTASEFRNELVSLGTCFCPDGQVPYILNSGRHAPDCHADERWVEDFDAMLASVVADAEARGRQHGLLAAALGIQSAYTARQRDVVMPDHEEKPMEHHLYAATLYIDREVTARAMGAVIDVAAEATDGR